MSSVGIFWDYENCAPPAGIPGYTVAERLRATCGVHGSITQFRAYLELSAPHFPPAVSSPIANTSSNPDSFTYPPTSPKTLALRSELQSSGVSLIDCPHNSRKNVADTMLACDLVCFALDHPAAAPHTVQPSPSSPYSIPSTPFSYISAPPIAPPKTTVVLVSGDRDFAYPLAVLKARRYDVGLIVPPGGAHPALRAQASWVLNWKDIMEDTGTGTGAKNDLSSAAGARGREGAGMGGQSSGLGVLIGVSGQPTESRPNPRRSSFASRRGSASTSRRGSVSAPLSSAPPVPPPPPTDLIPSKAPASSSGSGLHTVAPNLVRRPSLPPPPPEDPSPQAPPTPRMSRRPSIRRAAKTGSRPPSRSRSRVGMKGSKSDKVEHGVASTSRAEQTRPTIVPVALTVSPVGSVGPSFAAMSPQGQTRPHTPPLFSTHPMSPPTLAAPPSLAPPPTPPVKSSTPPAKPPTPPRDAVHAPHRPSIPHVATPRPPVPVSQEPAATNKPGVDVSSQDARVQVAPPPPSALQTLVPAASALRATTTVAIRPALTVASLVLPASNTPALTPATPVTPPASPPFRIWARLQPVYDGTDAEGDQTTSTREKIKKGKEKSKEDADAVNEERHDDHQHIKPEETATQEISGARREPTKLAVEVGMIIRSCEEPSVISGVDSILRSYTERTPGVEHDGQSNHFSQDRKDTPAPESEQQIRVPTPEDEDEDEEKFDESFFASLARPGPNANWTPPTAAAPRTPSTVKILSLDFVSGDNGSAIDNANDVPRSRFSTPRPAPRTSHSLPIGVPIMQSLLAGVEGSRNEFNRNSLGMQVELEDILKMGEPREEEGNLLERVHSRASSPPMPPTFLHRKTSLPATTPVNRSTLDLPPNRSAGSTYREFRVLIGVLERWRRNGNARPLRSLIGAELSRDVFAHAGVTSFREYVNRAGVAGVVEVGGGAIQGREWISLSRHWQGLEQEAE